MGRYQLYWKVRILMKAFFVFPLILGTICAQNTNAQEQQNRFLKRIQKAEIFVDIGGNLHGIAFDNQNRMYVAKNGKEILKITPEGKVTLFVTIEEANGYYIDGPGDTFIYDMEYGIDHYLYVAAEDRILKIAQDGQVMTVLKQNFKGRWGVCGIALDKESNIFVSFDNKILKIQPNGKSSIFIDGSNVYFKLGAVVGLEFDSTFKHLYACDGKRGETGKLIKIPIKANGSSGTPEIIFKKNRYRPEYVSIDKRNNIVIKGPENDSFVVIERGLTPIIIECSNIHSCYRTCEDV